MNEKRVEEYPTKTVTVTICTRCRQAVKRPHTSETCPRGKPKAYVLVKKDGYDPDEGPFWDDDAGWPGGVYPGSEEDDEATP